MTVRSAVSFAVLALGLASSGCRAAAQAEPQAPRFEVLALQHAAAGELAPPLARVFAGSTLRVEPDVRTNSLVLAGAPSELEDAKGLIASLDVEVARETETAAYEVIALQYAEANEVREALQGLLPRSSSRISVDSRTNSLLVQASPESLVRIQDLVTRLDRKL
jgi:type II secretory pathway component GspD/PulD (secretin)